MRFVRPEPCQRRSPPGDSGVSPSFAFVAMGRCSALEMREDGVGQATLLREPEPLDPDDVRLLSKIASGVTTDVAARHLELSARTLRRRLRGICDRIGVSTPIEAVVWAARHDYI
jgi:DNA-binding NarL/FixJ family response regulator